MIENARNNINIDDNKIKESRLEAPSSAESGDNFHSKESHRNITAFIKEYYELHKMITSHLKKKYDHLSESFFKFTSFLDEKIQYHTIASLEGLVNLFIIALDYRIDNHIGKNQEIIIEKIDILLNKSKVSYWEKNLQNLLIEFPQIIEPKLAYLSKEYRLGNTSFRGDILFQDINRNKVNVELKVVVPSFNKFKEQISNYLNNVGKGERTLYIAPKLTPEQRDFCSKHNIEIKIINLDEIFN